MTPTEEFKSLQQNPLPPEAMVYTACPSSEVLATVVYLKERIDSEQQRLDYLKSQMEQLQSRIVRENIKEQGQYFVREVLGKQMRKPIDNLLKFKARFPEGYELIRLHQSRVIEDRFKTDMLNLEDSAIPLTLADAKIGKDLVTEFVGFLPQKVQIEVWRRQERLE